MMKTSDSQSEIMNLAKIPKKVLASAIWKGTATTSKRNDALAAAGLISQKKADEHRTMMPKGFRGYVPYSQAVKDVRKVKPYLKTHFKTAGGVVNTHTSSIKEIVNEIGAKPAPQGTNQVVSEAHQKLKKELAGKIGAKTAAERPHGQEPQAMHHLTREQQAANVLASRESLELGEAERARQMGGHLNTAPKTDTHADTQPDRGTVKLAPNTVSLNKQERGIAAGITLPVAPEADKIGAARQEPSVPSVEEKGSEPPAELPSAPLEPGNPDEAVDTYGS
jgi:hypothetical protein